MVKYLLSGILYVFLLLELVIAGLQNVLIFPNQDLTSFYLSKLSGTVFWLFRSPFLYVFVDLPCCLGISSICHSVCTLHIRWGWFGEVLVSPGFIPIYRFGDLLSSIQHTGCWWRNLMQAIIKPCSWLLLSWGGFFFVIGPYMSVFQLYFDCGLALV